jgi:hypothetical protein
VPTTGALTPTQAHQMMGRFEEIQKKRLREGFADLLGA